ncbi:MAG: deoxyribonuclease V [Pseudomonadota bacterium]
MSEAPRSVSHRWDLTPREAIALQGELRERLVLSASRKTPRFVAGTDVGFPDKGRVTRGALVVLSFPNLELVDEAVVEIPTRFPYVPGLLSFREAPVLLAAVGALRTTPDVLLCDGQGLAHPRRFGLACHLGLLTGIPSIGVAKSRLVGEHDEPGPSRGEHTPLRYQGERIGSVLRTRDGVTPLYVSPGHLMSHARANALTLACCTRYRLPETTRLADKLASRGR